MKNNPRILFCNCTYAKVVPEATKQTVLKALCDAEVPFEAVADLCELSARRDSSLVDLAGGGNIKIAACFPRAVKWLFSAANAPLDSQSTEVLNMRVDEAESVVENILSKSLNPNVPQTNKPVPNDEKTPNQNHSL